MVSRRVFVAGGAAGLAALAGAGLVLSLQAGRQRHDEAAAQARAPFGQADYDRSLIRFATLAANGHNTQPWLFRIGGGAIQIRPDLSRRTPVVDPDDHHLFASLGCAAENLSLAAAATGRPVDIVFSGPEAGLRAAQAPPGAAAVDELTQRLFAAIPTRQSTRSVYTGRATPAADLSMLASAAAVPGVGVALITEPGTRAAIRDLVVAGNDRQMADPAFMRELKDWIRFSPQSAMAHGDGLYAAASGNPTVPDWLGQRVFGLAVTAASEREKYVSQIDSSAGLAVFSADIEGPEGWVAAGRSCQRFALMATALGMKVAFVNQPVEVADLRDDLADLAGLRGRRPDILLRFGYGDALPYAPRRPVDAVIEA